MPISARNFASLVLAEFPELRGDLEAEWNRGLLHCEMGELARHAREAKELGNWDTFGRAVQLANRCLLEGDEAVDNAVYVSFLESIDFDGRNGQQAWNLLPNEQQRAWREHNDGMGRAVPRWMKKIAG